MNNKEYKEALFSAISEGMINSDGELKSLSEIASSFKFDQAQGIIDHYTDHDKLKSISEGKQLLLKRFDCMYLDSNEGAYIFDYLEAIIRELGDNTITKEEKEKLCKKIGEMKTNRQKQLFKRFYCDT